MVEFNSGRKKADYSNSSSAFNKYVGRLNEQHKTTREELGMQCNYGMSQNPKDMMRELHAQEKKALQEVKGEQRAYSRAIKQKQRDIKRGVSDNFII